MEFEIFFYLIRRLKVLSVSSVRSNSDQLNIKHALKTLNFHHQNNQNNQTSNLMLQSHNDCSEIGNDEVISHTLTCKSQMDRIDDLYRNTVYVTSA